jgi:hypothetical protein
VTAGRPYDPAQPAGATPMSPRYQSSEARSGVRLGADAGPGRRPVRHPQERSRQRWHPRRSTRVTVSPDGLDGRFEAGTATGPPSGPVEDFIQRRRASLLYQAGHQVLLQGLSCRRRPLPENGVDVFRHVFDLNAGHDRSIAPNQRQNMQIGATSTWARAFSRRPDVAPRVTPSRYERRPIPRIPARWR